MLSSCRRHRHSLHSRHHSRRTLSVNAVLMWRHTGRHHHDHPYVSALLNDGKSVYSHDDRGVLMGHDRAYGCSSSAFFLRISHCRRRSAALSVHPLTSPHAHTSSPSLPHSSISLLTPSLPHSRAASPTSDVIVHGLSFSRRCW
jgi:hypothetical protein